MSRVILVLAHYFGSSNGVDIIELDSSITTKQQAWDEAMKHKGRETNTFNDVRAKVIEIDDREALRVKPRKLTWKERFTGRIDPAVTNPSLPTKSLNHDAQI
jgi:hypothetical protein